MTEGPVEGNKEHEWLSFSMFRAACGFVLLFLVLAMKNRTTAYRSMIKKRWAAIKVFQIDDNFCNNNG